MVLSAEPQQLRLKIPNNVLLRSRRALLLYKVYGYSALLVLNGTSLNRIKSISSTLFDFSQNNVKNDTKGYICSVFKDKNEIIKSTVSMHGNDNTFMSL